MLYRLLSHKFIQYMFFPQSSIFNNTMFILLHILCKKNKMEDIITRIGVLHSQLFQKIFNDVILNYYMLVSIHISFVFANFAIRFMCFRLCEET
jgi:hypothetical protein